MQHFFACMGVLMLAASVSVWADSEQPLLCQGRWHVWAGPTTSPGGIGQAGAGEGETSLKIHDCGRLLTLDPFMEGIPDGRNERVFHQQFDDSPQYRHETHARMPVVISLRMASSRKLMGSINIADGMVTKPLRLTLLEFDPELDAGCGDTDRSLAGSDDASVRTEVPRSEVLEAMVETLKKQGLPPPAGNDLQLIDYIHHRTTPAARGGDHTGADRLHVHRLYLRVSADGRILPREDALFEHRLACEFEEGELMPATHFLAFKPFRHTDGTHESTAQFIAVETGLIERAQMADGDQGIDGLADSMALAWQALQLPVASLSDGRH